jgi:2-oxo-4-hydroxy-4-carboxy--5-ureidoimidazoline (OHCU) decarboxylase
MTTDFSQIFELCYWVLEQAAGNPQMIKPTLVRSCLRTF